MAKKKVIVKSKSKTKSKTPILKTGDLPATQSMLTAVHKQIKASINSLEKKQDAKFNQMDAKFNQVESKINQVESKVELVLSEIHRMAVLMEEQSSRNKFVLDGYASLYERQDRVEQRLNTHVQDIEKLILKRTENIK